MVASAGSLAPRLLEAIFATEVLGVCFWKSDGRIVDANDAFLRIVGLTRADLEAGRVRWDDITPPEAVAADDRARQQLAATGQCATYEKEIVCHDGRRVPLLCSAVASDADSGIAFCIDISERRRAEAAASARARELAEVQRLAHIGRWRCDATGDNLVFSDEVYRIWGRAPGEVGNTMQETIDTVVHPDDRERLHALVAQGVTNRTIAYRIVRPDGEVRHVEASTSPLVDGDRIVAFAGVVQDVTERTLAGEALRQSEQRLRNLVDKLTHGVLLQGPRAEILQANAAALELLGLTMEQLIGMTSFDPEWNVIHEDGSPFPGPTHPVPRAIATGQPQRDVVMGVYRPRSRDRAWLLVNADPELGPGGEVLQVLCTFVDITERRRLQARLAIADRMASLGTLAAGVAHEINNPLAYVITNLGHVSARLVEQGGDDDLVTALREAEDGADRVRRIVRDLRTFARGDDDQRVPVDIARAIDVAVQLVRNQIVHTSQLTLELTPLPPVLASESRLVQLFTNLLVNAAQASDPDRRNEIVVIGWTDGEGRAVIEVRDCGRGIAAEQLPHVFDPFFSTKPRGMGMGMGLSICQGIVTEIGGEIAVDSVLGEGTKFRITLPGWHAAPVPPVPAPENVAAAARRARVLVVDDEAAIGYALSRVLADDHDVVAVTSGQEAEALLARDPAFDVIICDLQMPHMTGMELHARIAEKLPVLARRTIFLSGGAFTPAARAWIERATNPILDKPLGIDRLKQAIADVMALG